VIGRIEPTILQPSPKGEAPAGARNVRDALLEGVDDRLELDLTH
jgi:hypothetical protein